METELAIGSVKNEKLSSRAADAATVMAELHARFAEAADHAFIRSHLAESFWRFWPYRSEKPERSSVLWPQTERLLGFILPRSKIYVAEHKNRLVGWVIADEFEPLVHYAFTILPLRRLGICRALLSGVERPWRYWADTAPGAAAAKKLGGRFDPFALTFLAREQE